MIRQGWGVEWALPPTVRRRTYPPPSSGATARRTPLARSHLGVQTRWMATHEPMPSGVTGSVGGEARNGGSASPRREARGARKNPIVVAPLISTPELPAQQDAPLPHAPGPTPPRQDGSRPCRGCAHSPHLGPKSQEHGRARLPFSPQTSRYNFPTLTGHSSPSILAVQYHNTTGGLRLSPFPRSPPWLYESPAGRQPSAGHTLRGSDPRQHRSPIVSPSPVESCDRAP